MNRKRISRKIIGLIGLMEISAMLILYFIVNFNITEILKTKAMHDMNVIASDRAHMVKMYIRECCSFLDGYSNTSEIHALLENETDENKIKAAEHLTKRYAAGRTDLEGIYAANWNTRIIVHNDPDSVGTIFRDAASAKELKQLITQHDKAFCTGIVLAPVTKKLVISTYAPVFDKNQNAIGFIGAAFYIDHLRKALNNLADKSMAATDYSLINLKTNTYIYSNFSGRIGEECTNPSILKVIQKLKSSTPQKDSASFSNRTTVSVCRYIDEWDWAFVMKNSSKDVFSTITTLRMRLIIVCIVILFSMLSVLAFSVNKQMQPIKAIKTQIDYLKSGDYSHRHELEPYYAREDEFGTITYAVKELQAAMENQSLLFLEMLEAQTVGTLVTDDADKNVILINTMAMKLYGFKPEDKEKINMDDIRTRFSAEETAKIKKIREQTKELKEELIYETCLTRPDGTTIYVLSHAKRVTLSNGDSVVIFSFVDISDRKELEEKLRIRSETDYLTGICNRRSGEQRIEEALKENHSGMFCLFDVNKFKLINDNFGHGAGDDVLITIAEIMKRVFKNTDILVRLGGDEYAIYVNGITDKENGCVILNEFMEQIAGIDLPVLNGHKISVSLGAVIITGDKTFSEIYAKADSLMYECKKLGQNTFKFWDD